jgi:CRISPR-associated protein Csm2
MGWNYEESFYNVYKDDIKPILKKKDMARIDYIAEQLQEEENFHNFAEKSHKTWKLSMYSFVIAGELAEKGLKLSQLRKFYNYVKKMEYEVKGELPKVLAKLKFLLPKLAGSSKKEEVKPLYTIFAACIKNNIRVRDDVLSFIEFFEAILNYFETLSEEKPKKKN